MTETQTFMDEVKEKILFALANEPLNSRELEVRLGLAYPTVRRAITDMLDSGSVMKFDRRARNGRYVPGKQTHAPKDKVPTVVFKGRELKLTNLYLGQGIEDVTTAASNSILKAWTTIASTARRLNEGMPSTALMSKLNREKVALAHTRQNLEQLVFIINQLLDNPKLWESEHLVNFPEDPDWPEFLGHLNELYDAFYGSAD